MIALQYAGQKTPLIGEHPEPSPGPGEVLVRIETVATCPHWDMHLLADEPMFPGVPFTYPYPVGQPGHESAGVVTETGVGVEDFTAGDRVAAWRDPGQTRPGSYAQFNVFDRENLIRIPENLSFESVTSLELAMCVQVTFDRLLESDLVRHRSIAVSGMGPAGLVAIQMARAYGAREVFAIEPHAGRRDLAEDIGVDAAWSPNDQSLQAIERRTDSAFDVAIDCTGLKASIEFLMDRTTHAVSIFGVLRENLVFAPRHWVDLALIGYGSHSRSAAERALDLIKAGAVNLEPLLSDTLPLSRYTEGIDRLRSKQAIKICFRPWEA